MMDLNNVEYCCSPSLYPRKEYKLNFRQTTDGIKWLISRNHAKCPVCGYTRNACLMPTKETENIDKYLENVWKSLSYPWKAFSDKASWTRCWQCGTEMTGLEIKEDDTK